MQSILFTLSWIYFVLNLAIFIQKIYLAALLRRLEGSCSISLQSFLWFRRRNVDVKLASWRWLMYQLWKIMNFCGIFFRISSIMEALASVKTTFGARSAILTNSSTNHINDSFFYIRWNPIEKIMTSFLRHLPKIVTRGIKYLLVYFPSIEIPGTLLNVI